MNKKKSDAVEQIRDIVFGSEIRQYQEKFQSINAKISKNLTKTEEGLADLRSQLEAQSKDLSLDLGTAVDFVRSEIETLGNSLQKSLEDSESRSQSRLEKSVKKLESRLSSLRDDFEKWRSESRAELLETKAHLQFELDDKWSKIENSKASREQLSQAFVSLGKIFSEDMENKDIDLEIEKNKKTLRII